MAGRASTARQHRASSNGSRPLELAANTARYREAARAAEEAELNRQKARLAALSAAGRQIDVRTRDGRKLIRKPGSWQKDVWTFFDAVPQIKYAGRFFGNAGSRLRLYPGVVVDPDEPPVSVDVAVGDPEIALPESIAQACLDETDRLSNSADGMAGIMRGFMENVALVGECYLLGRASTPEDPVLGDEYWQVYSTSAITQRDDQVMIKETPDGKPQPLPPGSDPVLYRIWRRHAQWPGLADSNMSAVLDECEELLIYGRLLRAIGRSQTMGQIFKLPIELDLEETPRAEDPGGGQVPVPSSLDAQAAAALTELERRLMTSWVVANESDGSPASVAPFILRGKADHLKEAKFETLTRPIDDKVIERMKFLIDQVAHGADLPVEVLTGVADANHWTGWQIEDSTYKAHVEPTAQIPASALTAVFLRPALIERGVDQSWLPDIAFGIDASALVVRPNRGQDARDAYDRHAISWEALRNYMGFPESDAPTPQELVVRAALDGTTIVLPGARPATQAPPALPRPEDGGEPRPDEGDADEDRDEDRDERAARARLRALRPLALVAASIDLPGLGGQMVGIEQRLRDRLVMSANDELRAVLRRAGNKLKGALQGQPERNAVQGVAPEDVGPLIGGERIAELADLDDLLAGAFEPLRIRWDSWVPEAEAAAITQVQRNLREQADIDVEAVWPSAAQEHDNEMGWTALFLGLMALARTRLVQAVEAQAGEGLTDVAVPAGLVRDALAVAGGGQGSLQPIGSASDAAPNGLLSGPRWMRALRNLEINPVEWVWQVGFPTRPFPEHTLLAGVTFRDWQDEQLLNGSGFPPTSHYYPGDHLGCMCDAVPTFSRQV